MKTISILKNKIQEYDWGSYTAIPELLGSASPSDTPQAELWMGAHPKAPSMVEANGKWLALDELIEKHPEDILGTLVAKKFNNRLPYLFKVLAAAKPLSIQAHPNHSQAKKGFANENRLGILSDASERNYKDDNHKPECICALTPLWALNGFRNISEILLLLEKIGLKGVEKEIRSLQNHPNSEGLASFFKTMMTLESEQKKEIIAHATEKAERFSDDPIFQWIIRLYHEYPSDIGVLSPLWLNLICLEPGQAMFLPAGSLHAYLDGVGIELMANSDNVLRGGLTPKHVDVPELLQVLDFKAQDINILLPQQIIKPECKSSIQKPECKNSIFASCESVYHTPAEEFVLSVIKIGEFSLQKREKAEFLNKSVEILLCTEGKGIIYDIEQNQSIEISKGTSVIIPAVIGKYRIEGDLILYKASVP